MKRFLKMTATVFSAIVFSVSAPFSVHAGYILSLEQVGANVVATGSGSIDLADLAFYASGYDLALFDPDLTIVFVGSSTPNPDMYYSGIAGPSSFGSGPGTDANSGDGGVVGISAVNGEIIVPESYTSGASLGTSTSTFDNVTLADLGVTPGTYNWTWGDGVDADSFTLDAGVATVPEPVTLSLFGAGLAGICFARRRKAR
jgi:hypothetical protein